MKYRHNIYDIYRHKIQIIDTIDIGMKYRYNRYICIKNRYNRYRYKIQTIDIIDIDIKYRYNRYIYKI